ncbi:hypothetical protein CEXT_269081 [Caerostris extrusa]|uniref:Uncharacterized protein n=1 Tax=Caerostris extrusa TaxID=172846 RepID=A0AAV4R8C3_CAEEX|nr:hypothetical protein CEXT_269081 [Caerostris extrusa]
MSLTPSSKRIHTYWYVFLLFAAVISSSSYGSSLIDQYRDHLNKFNEIVQWTFSPLGSFSVEIVDPFVNSEIYVILQETIDAQPAKYIGLHCLRFFLHVEEPARCYDYYCTGHLHRCGDTVFTMLSHSAEESGENEA